MTLLCLYFQVVAAIGYSQYVSLQCKNENITSVLQKIEKQTGLSFFYNDQLLQNAGKITLSVNSVPLKQTLNQILSPNGLSYTIEKNIVVIAKATETPPTNSRKNVVTIGDKNIGVPALSKVLGKVRGIVKDESGSPIANVTIMIKGTSGGTSSNDKGFFEIETDVNQTLLISAVGYESQTIKAEFKGLINIVLKQTITSGENIVINSGIYKKSNKSYTGSAIVITSEELQRFGTRNLITSLRNIDPSFNIIESNTFGSDPNRLPEIQIRGNASIPNVGQLQDQTRVDLNTPLIIMDGFEVSLRRLLDMNENEVETITILKDASATAIYGSRGANGVVVVTTRTPKPGRLRFSYRGDALIEVPDISDYNLLKARDKLNLEYLAGYYKHKRADFDLPLKSYYNYLLNEINSGVETDWLYLPLRNSIGQRHNINIQGGHEAFRYAASAQMNYISGVMKNSYRQNFNGTINLSYYYKNFRFRNNFLINDNKGQNSPYGNFSDYASMNPYWKACDENGKVLKILGDPGSTIYKYRRRILPTNPLYNATLNTFDKNNVSEMQNNTTIEWNIANSLVLSAQLGITKNTSQTDRFRPSDHTAFANHSSEDIFRKGDYNYAVGNFFRYEGAFNLSYSKLLYNKHLITAVADYNIRHIKDYQYNFLVEGFNNPNFDFLPMALQYAKGGKPGGSESLVRAIGLTGNATYTYNNRYVTEFSYRADGSSQFGKNKRFASFWSAGVAYNIHEEVFLKNNEYINRLKIRSSLGTTGSQQGFSAYQSLSTYKYYIDDRYYIWNGSYLLGLGNKDLKWQQTFKTNIGIDAEFFKRRLSIRMDYYIQNTKDLVSSVLLQPSSGFNSYIDNIGKIQNKGFEINATIIVINNISRKITWSLTGGVVQNNNEVLETSKALKEAQETIRKSPSNADAFIYTEGYSSNTIWAVRSLGIDPSSGKEVFLDKNGNPTYTWRGGDVVPVGNAESRAFGNFSTFFRIGNLAFNAAFQYQVGGQQYNSTLVHKVETSNFGYNVDARVYNNRWKSPGDIAAFKGIYVTTPTYKTSRFVQNNNTLSCRNINLQYDVKSRQILRVIRLESLQLAANMADPFRISTIRMERGTFYPFSRQFSINITAIF